MDKSLCVWVLAGSPVWAAKPAIERLPQPDRVIAANGGSSLAAQLGITPDLIVGDLDSADPSLVQEWEARGVEIRRYGHATKSETDTELAVLAAVEWLLEREGTIYLLGGTSGRLDHTLANVLLLTHPTLNDKDLRVIEGRQEAFLAKPGRWNPIEGQPGDLMSLLPVGGDVINVQLEGFVYPLNGETLQAGRGQGGSNELATHDARLWLDSGYLLVVLSHSGKAGDV